MSIVTEIRSIHEQSKQAWITAVDTAGPEYSGGSNDKREEMQSLSDACDEAYEAAAEDLEGQYEGWAQNARIHLEQAKSLESEGGDCSHAITALEALDEYLTEDAEESAPTVLG